MNIHQSQPSTKAVISLHAQMQHIKKLRELLRRAELEAHKSLRKPHQKKSRI